MKESITDADIHRPFAAGGPPAADRPGVRVRTGSGTNRPDYLLISTAAMTVATTEKPAVLRVPGRLWQTLADLAEFHGGGCWADPMGTDRRTAKECAESLRRGLRAKPASIRAEERPIVDAVLGMLDAGSVGVRRVGALT